MEEALVGYRKTWASVPAVASAVAARRHDVVAPPRGEAVHAAVVDDELEDGRDGDADGEGRREDVRIPGARM